MDIQIFVTMYIYYMLYPSVWGWSDEAKTSFGRSNSYSILKTGKAFNQLSAWMFLQRSKNDWYILALSTLIWWFFACFHTGPRGVRTESEHYTVECGCTVWKTYTHMYSFALFCLNVNEKYVFLAYWNWCH